MQAPFCSSASRRERAVHRRDRSNSTKDYSRLDPQQVHTFYEACGHMISAQGQKSQQERLIAELMSYPNQAVRFYDVLSLT